MLSWLFSRRKARPLSAWNLARPLLQWSPWDAWTIGNSVEGTLILGSTGSGKSSGSGRTLAEAMLAAGFGGLVLTAKADERAAWMNYCRRTGRLDDLLIFGPDQPLRFNFLDYERTREGGGAGLTENLVNVFSTVLEVAERGHGQSGGREDEGFWRRANRQLCRNLIDLALLSSERLSIPELYALLVSAPSSPEQVRSEDWRQRSLLFLAMQTADRRPKSASQARDFALVADFFLVEWPALSEKTRSVIVATFTSMIDVLNRGLLHDLFCTETNVTPEAVADGKILVVDLPVKEFGEVGQFGQVLLKFAFQRAIERRDVAANPRPVFLWADEAQYFLTSYDQMFQTTCRAARVATVLLTQNVSNVYAALGGSEKGRAEADSLFACLNTKVLHANGDSVTNQWAANLIGRTRHLFINASRSQADDGWFSSMLGMPGAGQQSAGMTESFEFDVQPAEFTKLRTGGPENGWQIDGLVFQNGKQFRSSGKTWLPVVFRQRA